MKKFFENMNLSLPLRLFGIFAGANPLIQKFFEKFSDLFSVQFWYFLLTAVGVFTFLLALRFNIANRIVPDLFNGKFSFSSNLKPLKKFEIIGPMFFNTLILCNIIFLIQNCTDIYCLWIGMRPHDFYLSEYAYFGIFCLTVAVVLVAFFTCLTFTQADESPVWARNKIMVYVWLGQCVVLLLSCLERLLNYIDYFGLTSWRIFGLSLLALFILGIGTVVWKVASGFSVSCLIRLNVKILILWTLVLPLFSLEHWCEVQNFARLQAHESTDTSIAPFEPTDFKHSLPVIYQILTDSKFCTHLNASALYNYRLAASRVQKQKLPSSSYWQNYHIATDSAYVDSIFLRTKELGAKFDGLGRMSRDSMGEFHMRRAVDSPRQTH